ncbi:MAG: hypothetical protein ACI9J3_002526 [Parvicellaceae bacterium]|jgi:hypothetical protein
MIKSLSLVSMLAFAMLFSTNSSAQSFSTAIEYMNFIGTHYEQISKDQWSYTSAVAHDKSAKKIDAKRKSLLSSNLSAQKKVAKMAEWDGDGSYRDAVVKFLTLNYDVLNQDYAKIVDMEEIAEQSYDLMEAYLMAQEQASDKINEASKMLSEEQSKFAEANEITLLDNQTKRAKKLENAGLVYSHYNEIYLIFFKCYKQEIYVLDAMNQGDVSSMEQNNSALLSYAEEGLEKLKTSKPYGGDKSLIEAGVSILEFYKSEAAKDNPVLIDSYLKKENFEKINASFTSKKDKDKTQEDVDQYNQAVNDYNVSIEANNKTNESLNKVRAKKIDLWNNISKKYTRKHVH